jgi:hypothetical protein
MTSRDITVQRAALKKFEASILFQVVCDLQKDISVKRKPSWEGDSIARIIGMSDSRISDGADNHDLYLYGDHRGSVFSWIFLKPMYGGFSDCRQEDHRFQHPLHCSSMQS